MGLQMRQQSFQLPLTGLIDHFLLCPSQTPHRSLCVLLPNATRGFSTGLTVGHKSRTKLSLILQYVRH